VRPRRPQGFVPYANPSSTMRELAVPSTRSPHGISPPPGAPSPRREDMMSALRPLMAFEKSSSSRSLL
jgi:hypothetical protein